jgi:hypothetical protein
MQEIQIGKFICKFSRCEFENVKILYLLNDFHFSKKMPAFRWLISLFLSWLLCHIPVAAGEDSIDPGLDSTLNHVKYDSIISLSYNPRAAAEKARLLDSIAKSPTATGVFVDFGHPRYNLLYAMYGFWRHGERYEAEAKRSKENYDEVDEHHKEVDFLIIATHIIVC